MIFWLFMVGIVVLGAAAYLASYGIWAARQKNWLGAVGIWVFALMTLTAPLSALFIHWLSD